MEQAKTGHRMAAYTIVPCIVPLKLVFLRDKNIKFLNSFRIHAIKFRKNGELFKEGNNIRGNTKEIQIVYRFSLVLCYLLQEPL